MRLSVILPARNAELFLERAFDSVASLPDTELIVVPHDSADDTALVAHELVTRVPRASIAESLEQAFARCTGEFVSCLEAHAALVPPNTSALLETLAATTADAVVFQTQLEAHRLPEPGSTFVRRSWSGGFGVLVATDPISLVNSLGLAARVDWHDEVVSSRTTVSPRNPRPTFSDIATRCAGSIEALLQSTSAIDVRRAVLETELARLAEALPHLAPRHQAALALSLEPTLASAAALLPKRLQRRTSRARLLLESQLTWAGRMVRDLATDGAQRASSTRAGRVLWRLARPHRS